MDNAPIDRGLENLPLVLDVEGAKFFCRET